MHSVGIDLVETQRFVDKLNNRAFLDKVFTKNEIEFLNTKKGNAKIQSAAARFAAKEAFSKAIKTGIFKFPLTDVEVYKEQSGAVALKLYGKAKELTEGFSFSLSITHTENYASAVVIAEKEGN